MSLSKIESVLTSMNGREVCGYREERANIISLGELIMALTGVNEHGDFDLDDARKGRVAAHMWLRENGLLEP